MSSPWRKSVIRYKSYFLSVANQYKEREDLKAYLEIIMSSITVSVFAIFALKPTLVTITGLKREIDEKQKTIDFMKQKILNISKAQSTNTKEQENIKLLNLALPSKPEVYVFIRQIEGLSSKHQIQITSFAISGITVIGVAPVKAPEVTNITPENAKSVPFALNVSAPLGSYPNLLSFLNDLENLRRLTILNNYNFSVVEKEDGGTTINLNLIGSYLYYKEGDK